MYDSFKVIDNFVKDVFGFVFLKRDLDPEVALRGLTPIKNAHATVMNIMRDRRVPFPAEFVTDVYPILEVALHWQKLREKNEITAEFLNECRKKLSKANYGNFFGAIFEVDMACRCLLSGWNIQFVEDCTKQDQSQIDFVFFRKGRALAVDCRSLRATGYFSPAGLIIDKIDAAIDEHAEKFQAEHLHRLGKAPDDSVLIVDITTQDYVAPLVLGDLDRVTIPEVLDAVVFTWREDITKGKGHILRAKYRTLGNRDYGYFSTTYEAHLGVTDGRLSWLFIFPTVFPKPIISSPSGLIRGATDDDFLLS